MPPTKEEEAKEKQEEEGKKKEEEYTTEEEIVEAYFRGDIPIARTPKPNEAENNMTVIPILKRRSIEAREREKYQQYEGWDKDMEKLVNKGYTIKDSHEQIPGYDPNQFLDTS